MRLTREFSRIRLAAPPVVGQPIKVGEIAELIRNTLSKEYGLVPPNLNTTLDQTGKNMTISAVDQSIGINISIQITDNNQPQQNQPQLNPAQPTTPPQQTPPPQVQAP
jgi:hypothetical protein